MSSCSVRGCFNRRNKKSSEDMKLLSFPKDPKMAEEWAKVCKKGVNMKNARICSVHFEPSCFERPLKHILMNYQPKRFRGLKSDAVPTLNVPLFFDTLEVGAEGMNNAETVTAIKIEMLYCRICAKKDVELLPIFGGGDKTYEELINRFLPITVRAHDGRPQRICVTCANTLTDFSALVHKCKESERGLELLFRQSGRNKDAKRLNCKPLETSFPTLNSNTVVPPIQCDKCKFLFYTKSQLQRHYIICNDLECYRCLRMFCALYDNYSHLRMCNSFVCRGCAARFGSAEEHRIHVDKCVEEALESDLVCKRCLHISKYHDDFERHVDECWSQAEDVGLADRRLCETCDCYFEDGYEYVSHVKQCRTYRTSCGQRFPNLNAMYDHINKCNSETSNYEEEIDFYYDNPSVNYYSSPSESSGSEDEGRYDNCLQKYENRVEDLFKMLKRRDFQVRSDAWCPICNGYFHTKDVLRNHLNAEHDAAVLSKEIYPCGLCDLSFNSILRFSSHYFTKHSRKREYPYYLRFDDCQHCGKRYFQRHKYKLHIVECVKKPNLRCSKCNTAYATEEILSAHMIMHNKQHDTMRCKKCDVSFDSLQQMHMHRRMEHSTFVSVYRCCSTIFSQYETFQKHFLEVHKGDGSRTVVKILKGKPSYVYRVTHKIVEGQPVLHFACGQCNQIVVATLRMLNMHIRLVHNEQRVYCCVDCGIFLETLSTLNSHKCQYYYNNPKKKIKMAYLLQ